VDKFYRDVNPEQMILRDHLAHDRTVLANERTLLAYVRTAIAILAGGGTLLKVFPEIRYLHILGGVLLVLGGLVLVLGMWRFVTVACRLRRVYRKSEAAEKADEQNRR
jgi:putative membrane protein